MIYKDESGKIYLEIDGTYYTENIIGKFAEVVSMPSLTVLEEDFNADYYIQLSINTFLSERDYVFQKEYYLYDKEQDIFLGIGSPDRNNSFISYLIPCYNKTTKKFLLNFNPFTLKDEEITNFLNLCDKSKTIIARSKTKLILSILCLEDSYINASQALNLPLVLKGQIDRKLDSSDLYKGTWEADKHIIETKLSLWHRKIEFSYLGVKYSFEVELFQEEVNRFIVKILNLQVC